MKILLLPDKEDHWSAHNRSLQLEKHLIQKGHEVKVTGGDALVEKPNDISELFSWAHLIHFLYSSGIHRWVEALKPWYGKRLIIGSTIGHRWWAGAPDQEEAPEASQAIACMKRMNHVTAQTQRLYETCRRVGILKVTKIPNGIDKDLFSPKPIKVGHVGPTNEADAGDYKGGHMTVLACRQLGLEFVHGGQYQMKQVSHDKMPDFYKQIDVLCQPSVGEGCSNPILEALQSNVRVLTTWEACPDWLVPYVTLIKRNVDDIKNKLCPGRMISNWETIAGQYEEVYERVAREAA